MRQVHFTLQGKGGVGKSVVASFLAQFHQHRSEPVTCVDTDPVNATLAGYEAFRAIRLDLMDGSTLVERRFDDMVERILAEDVHFVIDNGAASFIPLSNYLIENRVVELIQDAGKCVVAHVVVTGGQALLDTLRGLNQLCEQLPECARVVVWLNEYFGDVIADGKRFEEMKLYARHAARIHAIVRIPRQTASTFGRDLEFMLHRKLTFEQTAGSAEFGLMAKQRLAMIQRSLFQQLELAV